MMDVEQKGAMGEKDSNAKDLEESEEEQKWKNR